jgi:alkylation response protein AidB-like acyl-CoA dehydrogenase
VATAEARDALRAEARRFALEEVLPAAGPLDRERAEIPGWMLERLADLGYFGLLVPRAHGGLGLGVVEYCLVTEELARAWLSVASVIAYTNGSVEVLAGRPELLPRMARGTFVPAFALTEPQAGSDAAAIACRAERDGDGWRLTGRKRWCGYARNADAVVLYARTGPAEDAARHHGISAFLVEKERGAFPPGMEGRPIDKIGYFGITSWELDLHDLRLPGTALLGEEGAALRVGLAEMNTARVQTAARAVGAARGALEDAVAYAGRRTAFGRPLARQQAIRFKLAAMATQVEAARRLTLHAAALLDAGEDAVAAASMAKLFAADAAELVASEALQVHGGNGYTTEHDVERHWRDARLLRIVEGTSEIQHLLVARALLGSEGA